MALDQNCQRASVARPSPPEQLTIGHDYVVPGARRRVTRRGDPEYGRARMAGSLLYPRR
jgi:hypothetical protein